MAKLKNSDTGLDRLDSLDRLPETSMGVGTYAYAIPGATSPEEQIAGLQRQLNELRLEIEAVRQFASEHANLRDNPQVIQVGDIVLYETARGATLGIVTETKEPDEQGVQVSNLTTFRDNGTCAPAIGVHLGAHSRTWRRVR